jgi:esterase/lipase superfamily enzyme
MGNRALTRVLHDWGSAGEPEVPFHHVVLTAPDIDADTFKGLAAAIRMKAERVTLYSSHLDKALLASKKFHGYPRAGEVIVIVRGIDTIDASAVNTSFLGHSHFAESRSVLEDIYWLFQNQPVAKRFGILPEQGPNGVYYVFRP